MTFLFSPVEALRHLADVLTGDRADGRVLAWDATQQAHVYVDQSGGLDGSGFSFDGGDATGQEAAFFDGGSA